MFPFLSFFGKQIPTYGLLIVIGVGIGVILALVRGKKTNILRQDIFYSILYCIIGAMIGAKILYIFTAIPQMAQVWNQVDNHLLLFLEVVSNGGFVFYGGFIGAVAFCYLYTRKYQVDFLSLCDLFAPSVALGHAIGRVGCFLAGCCYGIPSAHGIAFHYSPAAPNGIPLFPVQLVEAGLNVLLCILLLFFDGRKKHKGNTALLYIVGYAIIRFALEFFRGDGIRGVLFGISLSQYISIGIALFAVIVLVVRNRSTASPAENFREKK